MVGVAAFVVAVEFVGYGSEKEVVAEAVGDVEALKLDSADIAYPGKTSLEILGLRRNCWVNLSKGFDKYEVIRLLLLSENCNCSFRFLCKFVINEVVFIEEFHFFSKLATFDNAVFKKTIMYFTN